MLIDKWNFTRRSRTISTLKLYKLFTQGGAPAVEAFADQLEQQEQAQAMASRRYCWIWS
jgi:hypothetical protein